MTTETSTQPAPVAEADAPSVAAATGSTRYHGLDALRGFAMMLGIVLHAALSYFLADSGYGAFWPQDERQSEWSGLVFSFIHSWRMPTFFLLAGFFAHLVLDRRGDGYFINDRLKRILVPLLIFGTVMALIIPSIWVTALAREWVWVNPLAELPPTVAHLWFIYHLVYMYAFLLAARWIASQITNPPPFGRALLAVFVNRWQVALIILLVVIAVGRWIENVDDNLLWPIGPFDFLYGFIPFLLGYGIYKRRQLIEQFSSPSFVVPVLAVATLAFIGQMVLDAMIADKTLDIESVGLWHALVASTATVGFTFGLIGLFQRLFSTHSTWVRWVADSSYWVYIMHLPVGLIIALSMFQLPWPAELKFLIVCVTTGALGFGSYWLFIRYTPIGTMLNGKRVRGYVGRPPSMPPSDSQSAPSAA